MFYENEIFGCAFGCPLQVRLEDCPFNEFDHLSLKEKVDHINCICNEMKESIIVHHLHCTKNRK